ncbi:hypothetical protein BCR33DRAFT_496470 [Rhizoclosmatium globosum]|uniref:MYND-type domain-containing protein n=1 Tax=Rhizoclosmatium globosum TaxID=329046 RepID=A0A1Y2CVI2_9FUNG|nr:hypothetical protein BCR33DRAFT_496470 [Rhizoclosmatium globosum]|eukprot:ORY50824.1 hypothetical protein BCR33DRAFT_496470 [Rhizoclosmatium globosum]
MAVDAFLFSSSFYGMYKLITAVLNKPGGIRALFADPTFFLMDLQRTLFDERNLLAAMQGNPIITCDCLNVEDPYHKDFGKVIPSNLLFDVELMERPRGYKVDCSYCQKRPDLVNDGVDFKKCARCHRVRYCSVECQKLAWPSHKSLCGIKSADWWGRTPRMSKQERIDLGLV